MFQNRNKHERNLSHGRVRLLLATMLLSLLFPLALGCGSEDGSQVKTQNKTPTPQAENGTSPLGDLPSSKSTPPEGDPLFPKVDIATTLGHIILKLNAQQAPGTVHSFIDYINQGFYVDTLFHFAEPGKIVIAGGYTIAGQLKPTRPSIRNEAHNGLKNTRGSVAMTRSPDAIDGATSQFFINLADAPNLDHVEGDDEKYGYCVFGEVIEGLDIADKISQAETVDKGGDLAQTPKQPVVIQSITLL